MTQLTLHLLTLAIITGAPAVDRWIAYRYQLSTRWTQ